MLTLTLTLTLILAFTFTLTLILKACSVSSCDGHGVLVLPESLELSIENSRIRSNSLCGVLCHAGPQCHIGNQSQVSHNGEAGVSVRGKKGWNIEPDGARNLLVSDTRIESNGLCGLQVQHGSKVKLTKATLIGNTIGCSLLGLGSHLVLEDTLIRGGKQAAQGIAVTAAAAVELLQGTVVEAHREGVALTTGGTADLRSGVVLKDNNCGISCEGYREALNSNPHPHADTMTLTVTLILTLAQSQTRTLTLTPTLTGRPRPGNGLERMPPLIRS